VSRDLVIGPSRLGFWRAFVTTARPYLAWVSGSSGLVGLVLAGTVRPAVFAGALAVFGCAYGFGQAATDVFQTDTDSLSAPYRPLSRNIVRPRDVLFVAVLGLLASGALLAALNAPIALLATLAVAGLLTYTPMKRRFWAGPLHNAFIVALLPAMGAMCGGASLGSTLSSRRVLLAMASSLLSYVVFVLLGYLKDVGADRATGYDTFPVRFGRMKTVAASAVFGALAVVPSALLISSGPGRLPLLAALLWLGGVGCLGGAHLRMAPVRRDEDAHPAIAMSVRAFVLLRSAEALALAHSASVAVSLAAIAALAAFELTLVARPERTQV
jgi:4-hydroxybenzoate polyprenyltransferase